MGRPKVHRTEEELKQRNNEASRRYVNTEHGKVKRKAIMAEYYQKNKEHLKAQRKIRYHKKKAEKLSKASE